MKRRPPRVLTWVRDLFFIYLFCAGLCVAVLLTTGSNKRPVTALSFNGAFAGSPQKAASPLAAPSHKDTETDVLPAHPPKKGTMKKNLAKSKGKVKTYSRIFVWKDPGKRQRRTRFRIDASLLKKEMRRFGTPPGMKHPMMMKKRGFKVISRRNYMVNRRVREQVLTMVDYQKVFKRSLTLFPPFTKQLSDSAGITAGTDPLRTFLTFVQQITYKKPPVVYQGNYVNEFFTPVVCLYEQYGDCDSKSILLADFLATVPDNRERMGMVLVRGRGLAHAMLAVKRRVMPGMTALYFRGKGYYIVVETTRPGWAPGFVDRRITGAIKAGMFQFEELKK